MKKVTDRALRKLLDQEQRKDRQAAYERDAECGRRTTEMLKGSERLGDRDGLPYDR